MNLKPKFIERMKLLLGEEYEEYKKILDKPYLNSIRCNTIKISPEDLKKKLADKFKIKQPYKSNPEIMVIENNVEPGEIGRATEHVLGYYYVQEISSMMPPIVLNPKEKEVIIDLAASPGSKTTQMSAIMKNTGTIIANEVSLGRISILSTNMQRCGTTNTIATHHDGVSLCHKLNKLNYKVDKILVDAPCSGEGTLRTAPKTASMFNENIIRKLSSIQKRLAESALKVLKKNGTMVYSTCTHAPEENEEVMDYLLSKYPIEIQEIKLPLKTRPGIAEWKDKKYSKQVKKCARIYPMDNNTEGFFICKIKLLEEVE